MKRVMIAAVALLAGTGISAAAFAQERPAAPAPDDIRLALARTVVGQILPPGTYRALMRDMFTKSLPGMMEGIGDLPVADLAQSLGVPEGSLRAMDKGTLGEIADIVDPVWKERSARVFQVLSDVMEPMFDKMEPRAREGLSRAYARAFTADELRAIDGFFATPAGAHYARDSYRLWVDPEVMKEMMGALPELMATMTGAAGDIEAKMKAAAESLPPPRTEQSLTDAERTRLKQLLGPLAESMGKVPPPPVLVPPPALPIVPPPPPPARAPRS